MRVRTSLLFEQALDKLLNCSNDIYNQKTTRAFYSSYKKIRILLSEQPYMGSEEPILRDMPVSFRHIVIRPYFKIIYTIVDDEVHLIDLWDTRRCPDALASHVQ